MVNFACLHEYKVCEILANTTKQDVFQNQTEHQPPHNEVEIWLLAILLIHEAESIEDTHEFNT